MNVFMREMKAHRWGLIFWSLGMVMMIYSGMAKYGAYEAAGQSVEVILEQIPTTVQAVFGMTGFDLTTAAGFFGMREDPLNPVGQRRHITGRNRPTATVQYHG